MSATITPEAFDDVVTEYLARFAWRWSAATHRKYRAELRSLRAWLVDEGYLATTASLDFPTLRAYVDHLLTKPVAGRIHPGASSPVVERARSLNTVNASMRAIRAFVRWLFEDGRLSSDPFAKVHRHGMGHPLLPHAAVLIRPATVEDFQALDRGCSGRRPLDLRDRAIVAILTTTGARNSAVRLLRVADVDLERGTIRLPSARATGTYEACLVPEARSAIVRYLRHGRPKLLWRDPVVGPAASRGDPGYLFLRRDSGGPGGAGPLGAAALSDAIDRRYHAGGGMAPSLRSQRLRHGVIETLASKHMPLFSLCYQLGYLPRRSVWMPSRAPKDLGRDLEAALAKGGLIGGGGRGTGSGTTERRGRLRPAPFC